MSKSNRPYSDAIEAIRKAIMQAQDAGLSRYRIWQETGINQSTLSRFMAGSGLSADNLDRLLPLLGVTIEVKAPKIKATKATKPKRTKAGKG